MQYKYFSISPAVPCPHTLLAGFLASCSRLPGLVLNILALLHSARGGVLLLIAPLIAKVHRVTM